MAKRKRTSKRRRSLISEQETERLVTEYARRRLRGGQSARDSALAMAGQIGMHILSDPNALRLTGTLLETLGKVMQRTADSAQTTATTPPKRPGDVLYLSAFIKRKKEPSDG